MCFLAHPLPPQRAGTRTVMLPWSRGHTLPASLVPSIAEGWNPFRTSWKIVILGFHPWRSHSIGLGYGLRICIFKKHSRQSWVFLKNQCSIGWSPTRNLKCKVFPSRSSLLFLIYYSPLQLCSRLSHRQTQSIPFSLLWFHLQILPTL